MKRKDQMLIILELLEEIDIAKVHDYQDAFPMMSMIQNRILTLKSVTPKEDPFYKVIDHLSDELIQAQSGLSEKYFGGIEL